MTCSGCCEGCYGKGCNDCAGTGWCLACFMTEEEVNSFPREETFIPSAMLARVAERFGQAF